MGDANLDVVVTPLAFSVAILLQKDRSNVQVEHTSTRHADVGALRLARGRLRPRHGAVARLEERLPTGAAAVVVIALQFDADETLLLSVELVREVDRCKAKYEVVAT